MPRLSSLCSSLEEETLVNAGHVAPRFWEPAGEGWGSGVRVTFAQIMYKSSPN